MPAIRHDDLLLRLIRDLNDVRSALRRVVATLPLYDIDNENSPAQITADQNDYIPGNYDVMRLTSSAAYNITGIANGVKGRKLRIFNVGAYPITLVHASVASLAINRFNFVNASDFIIPPDGNVLLYYDATQQRWVGGDQSSVYDVVNESTPAQITSNQNNYDPGVAEVLRLSTNAAYNITGISGGVKGRFLEVLNVGTGRITFTDDDVNSLAANRFALPYDERVHLLTNARARFYYDSTQQRWTLSDAPNIQGIYGRSALIKSSVLIINTIATGVETKITPNTVMSDDWGYWDSVNSRFVIPAGENGLYMISISGSWQDLGPGGTLRQLRILKNNVENIGSIGVPNIVGSATNMNVTTLMVLVAGDYVDFWGRQDSGGNLNFNRHTSLSPIVFFAKVQ